MKKQVAKWMVATLVLTTTLSPSAALAANNTPTGSFADLGGVPAQMQQAILEAVHQGVLHGDPNGQFRPAAQLTREELAVIIQQALQLPLNQQTTSFSDVDPNGWASRAIEAVRAAGIMQGDGNGIFRPTDLLTREEMAVLLLRASQQQLGQPRDPDSPVADWNGVSSWAQPYVRTALALGTMKAVGDNFAPRNSVPRQEAAGMLLQNFFPTDRLRTLGRVETDRAWINGVPYQLSENVKGVLNPQNATVLHGATLKFDATGRTVDRITSLELHANGTAARSGEQEFSGNLVLDGQGATLDGDLKLAGDYLSVQNLMVAGDFKIGPELANDFSARYLNVKGTTVVQGGDRNTVVFEDSQLGAVDVSKPNVRVEATGTTTVNQMTVSSDASIVGSETANVGQVTLADGAGQVEMQGSVGTLVVTGAQPVTLTGNANIGTVSVQTAAPVTLNNTGTVGKLQVLDPAAKVQVGQGLTVSNVALGAGVPSSSISGLATPATPGTTNTAPVQVTPILDQVITLENGDVTFDLAPYFHDAEQSVLHYVVGSTSPSTVKAAVNSAGLVTFTPLKIGKAKITVAVDDFQNQKINTSFYVTVNPAPPAPNQKPVVSTAPSNQSLTVGAGDCTLDLSTVFTDPDGDSMTFDAASSDSTVATATANGSQVTVHPLTAGTTTVTLSATDTKGAAETATFAVTVTNPTPPPPQPSTNHAPEAVSMISDQLLTPGITNARTYDLSQLFQDADGDSLTFTAVSNSAEGAAASVSGNMLTLTPSTGAASTTVTVTADDGKGGTATYNVKVRTAPLTTNGSVVIRTKQGVKESITYDLSTLFPNETSFTVYEGTPDSTFTGPATLNGNIWTASGLSSSLYTWVIGADGSAAVIQVVADPQGVPDLYFSQYLDAGDGRIALEMYFNGDGDPSHNATGYSLDVYRYMKKTNNMNVVSIPFHDVSPNMTYIVIDSIFYDFFDIINFWYYNEEADLYNPTEYNLTALVLKKDGRVVDVLGDPNSHEQFLPNGGTIIRKSGIYTGSQAFSQAGEWNTFPKGTLQFFGHHTP